MKMTKVNTVKIDFNNSYDYYIGHDEDNKEWYNIVPSSQDAPHGGYAKEWILNIKNVPDLFHPKSNN